MGFDWRTILDLGAIAGGLTSVAALVRARGQNEADIGKVLVDDLREVQARNKDLSARIDGLQVVAVTNERLSGQIERLGDQMTLLIEERRKMAQRSEQNTARIAELEKRGIELQHQNTECRELLGKQQELLENQQEIINRLQLVQRLVDGDQA